MCFLFRLIVKTNLSLDFFPARNAAMHLSFDTIPVKQGDNKVQDDSGNKNDAALANGAEISNRTMGKTCSTS